MLPLSRKATLAASLAALVAGAIASSDAVAQEGTLFQELDADEDGGVSRVEAYAGTIRIYASLDQNWDGFMSPAEASSPPDRFAPKATPEQRQELTGLVLETFQSLDVDGDNWVSRNEVLWLGGYLFTSVDSDRDGVVTMPELDAALQRLAESGGGGPQWALMR
jgi:Ca2+-binding EF-hand superfamily protein